LRDLVKFQAFRLDDDEWAFDVERLTRSLDSLVGKRSLLPRMVEAYQVLIGRTTHERAWVPASAPLPSSAMRANSPVSPVMPTPEPRRHEIFISHSSKDRVVADEIVRQLEACGRVCWIAPRDIPPGVQIWADAAVTAIAKSRLMLVLLTEHSNLSVDVQREVTIANHEKIPMLAVNLDTAPLSPGLKYFFVAGQRLDLARFRSGEQVGNVVPAVEQLLTMREA
jgi:hypothetical protein